jgi:anti-sigma regulatory factor (Ser/Thr protein kinase)
MSEGDHFSVEIEKIKEALQADVIYGNNLSENTVAGVYASDLMSDVLAYGKSGSVLLTGLNTIQAAISAHMAEFKAIIFIRGKRPGLEIQKFAEEKDLIILSTKADMFDACINIAKINNKMLPSDERAITDRKEENIITQEFEINGRDFASAGMVSTRIKSILKNIGYNPQLIRRIAISAYEGEMNVVMHALRAAVILTVGEQEVMVSIDDEGKGIPDVELAMQEGYSTSTEEQRAMGFGAGMGLPNMKRNSDNLKIDSMVGKGTRVEMRFFVK